MLDEQLRVKISDFGMAMQLGEDELLTGIYLCYKQIHPTTTTLLLKLACSITNLVEGGDGVAQWDS